MKIKTYGVPDLTEWHGTVKAGSVEVSVSFTGGTASPSGAQPAYFITKDPIVQFVIENSKEFKNGIIILVMAQDIAGEHPRMGVQKNSSIVEESMIESQSNDKTALGGQHVNDSQGAGAVVGECKIEVADKSEAIEYLKEHYSDKNYSATGLRTKGAFEAACKECGVEFVFTA